MVKCITAWASIEESDNFCMNCGNKIEKNNEHDILPLVTLIKCPNCKKTDTEWMEILSFLRIWHKPTKRNITN